MNPWLKVFLDWSFAWGLTLLAYALLAATYVLLKDVDKLVLLDIFLRVCVFSFSMYVMRYTVVAMIYNHLGIED